jgi:outer membrane protein TolC
MLLICLTLSAQSISYQELLKSASNESNRLKIFKTDENIESARLETIYGQYYPNLSVSYNTEYNRDLNGLPTGTESVGDTIITSGTRYQSSLSLNLNYELYHFGTTQKSINIAEKEVQVKHLLWCEEEKKLHQNILERYNSALKMKIQSDLKEQMLTLRQELFTMKERLYRAGQYSKIDLGDEAITIIDLQRELERASMQYQEDIIMLGSLSHVELDVKKTELLPIGFSKVNVSVDDFEDTTQGHKYTQQLRQKQEEISMYNRSQLPTLAMYGNYYLYGTDPVDAYDSFENVRKNSWKLGLSLRMSIFEGFKYNNESQRLRYELQRIKQERDLQKREYEYDAKAKIEKIIHLVTLEEKDQSLYDETSNKIDMVSRLRENYQVDSVSELNAKLEGLERELNLKIEQSEAAYENASLEIIYRGMAQCTQH